MADQEGGYTLDDGKPNQISVGLIETISSRIISYMLDPTKVGDGAFCVGEHDPDYLPLVGLRTRRFGEEYPYPAIQGYRSGNEVEVVCYMMDETKDLPPPARVISYMKELTDCGTIGTAYYSLYTDGGFALRKFGIDTAGGAVEFFDWEAPHDLIGIRTNETGLSYIEYGNGTGAVETGGNTGYYDDPVSGLRIYYAYSINNLTLTINHRIENRSGATRTGVKISRVIDPDQGRATDNGNVTDNFVGGFGFTESQLIYAVSPYNGLVWVMFSDNKDYSYDNDTFATVHTSFAEDNDWGGGTTYEYDPDKIINRSNGHSAAIASENDAAMCMAWELGAIADNDDFEINYQFTLEQSVSCAIAAIPKFTFTFTLTWGENPRDLDLWFNGWSSANTEFEIGYSNLQAPNNFAELFFDDTTSYGPEDIRCNALIPGKTYFLYVNLYAGSGSLATSGASIVVKKDGIPVGTFTPPSAPSGGERYWNVLYIDGTTGDISDVKTITNDPAYPPGNNP